MAAESNNKTTLKSHLEELERIRGELRVQLHLAGAEAREAWNSLENKWERVENELGRIGEQAKQPLEEIGQATRTLLDEIKSGYERVRSDLKHKD